MVSEIPDHDALLDDPKNREEDLAGEQVECGNPECGGPPCTETEICACGGCPECCSCPDTTKEDESRDEDQWAEDWEDW